MSASVAARLYSHLDEPTLDQTNQHLPPLGSPSSYHTSPTPPGLQVDCAEPDPSGLSPFGPAAEDAMDHEPTPVQNGVDARSNPDSPTLPIEATTYFPDQMNVDSDANAHQRTNVHSAQEPFNSMVPTLSLPAESTASPPAGQATGLPMTVPVRTSERETPIPDPRIPPNTATFQPHGTHRPPAQVENVGGDENLAPGDTSSVEEENEDGEDDDEDESDREFLENLVEDLSVPTDEALKKLESSKELSALDHSIWESRVYKPLDDPEYRPKIAGRIVWTLTGFHGTTDAPNKQRIMRSPSEDIGGYLFNIKVFPRGNEGTDRVSVYIECSGPSSTTNNGTSTQWEVPAQIGCIMYNPQEPRVYKFEQATHHFEGDNPDWGWTRFHGPWSTLHVRRWDQRRPLLQHDVLAFCVYLRTVQDPTRGLWWHPSTDGKQWNSYAKTGLRAMQGDGPARRAVAAALAPWFHLSPFRKLITSAPIPRPHLQLQKRPWPMFEALHSILHQKTQEGASDDLVSIAMVEKLLKWYDADLSDSTDVIEVWENLRSILNREFHGDRGTSSQHSDVLAFIQTYKVCISPQAPSEENTPMPQEQAPRKQRSTQEIVETLFESVPDTYQEWDGHASGSKDLPPVLQIELIRQSYSDRRWRRLTHCVHINDTIRFKDTSYRLIGLVISRGKLGSGKTYSIVRSSDIGSQWVAYKSGKVWLLTSQSAVRSHEGSGIYREGEESVAQVLIYVRSSCCTKTLPMRPEPGIPILRPILALKSIHKTAATDPLATLPVVVHLAGAFEGYEGPGVVNPYRSVLGGVSGIELASHFNSESTIESVENYLRATKGNLQFKCSILEWQDPPTHQTPRPRFCSPTDKLGDVCFKSGRVHLWARRISDQLSIEAQSAESKHEASKDVKCMKPKELFIKTFNPSARRVTGVTSFVAFRDLRLSHFVALSKLPKGLLTIYVEHADGFQAQKSTITLDTLVSQIQANCILVIAPKEHKEDDSGSEHFNIHHYYLREKYRKHFAYQGSMYRRGYFGGVHVMAQLHNGLIGGYATRVETNGDYYSGNLKLGCKHGDGKMFYANGDTYIGGWSNNLQERHGKMVYHSTGNIYIGEWHEGRRHGSGTMTYQKTDEEQAMCHICYGNEINVMFYRCGHMLACEICARQCKECPLCRRSIDDVVKFHDMRHTGV